MKRLTLTIIAFLSFTFIVKAQTDAYNLKSQNLHKKVRKTIDHYYSYDKNSGGFVKKSVSIKNYNDDGNLLETYYLYNSTYSTNDDPSKNLYHYNSKNQLLKIENISENKSKYSTDTEFHYDNDGNLIRKENIYKDGKKSYSKYDYDRRDRVIRIESYGSNGKLSYETSISYKGSKRIEKKTSYSTKDGSIYGTYTTTFKNDVKEKYLSESKYGNSTTSYEYDNNGNLKESISRGKKTYIYKYDYEYDRKDNWVKKHYRSGKYQYFYFREIIMDNGDISGSTSFDRNFINRHGNFDNVAVVPLVKKKSSYTKKNNNSTTTNVNNYNSSMPSFRYKNWSFTYVNMKKKVSKITGTVNLSVENGNRMSNNSTVRISVNLDGSEPRSGNYTVQSYNDLGKEHQWKIKSNTKGVISTLYIFKSKKTVKGMDIDGLLIMGEGDKSITFYLQ
ncbi:MAG: hypothetical protein ACPGUU_00040 [Flavobacteriaceae bacterium]